MATSKQKPVDGQLTEETPLISKDGPLSTTPRLKAIYLILFCGFLTQWAFGVTQVPLIYVFRLMTCAAYYETNPDRPNLPDRCSVPQIEASTARAVSLMGFSTTFFGIINLFLTGWGIKRFGVKATLALQIFWPAARLAVQSIGVAIGGVHGIIILQCSQVITVVGGPVGYQLALNTYVTEVTKHRERTGYLGILQGCTLFGASIGFLLGGILADTLGIISPFVGALTLFMVSTVYVLLFLPRIAPASKKAIEQRSGLSRFFGPFQTIAPRKWILPDGHVQREYGAFVLATGVFLGVLATGYIVTMLQMYSTNILGFGAKRNSYLISMHMFLRGLFLTLLFPRVIAGGRRWMQNRGNRKRPMLLSTDTSGIATPTEQEQLATAIQDVDEQDLVRTKSIEEQETFEFDLVYTRFSLLVDGILTLGASFVTTGWQMFLIAALLPLGAGTASAAKGTILQMCAASEKTDALSAIAFVEMSARLSTTFVFGLIFAAFANMGKTYLVFACNAGVALFGFCFLFLSRFPPEGSKRLEVKQQSIDQEDP